jgi:single-strand DNA-binding protein
MINKAILIGNLGKDPELRYTANQVAVATFSIATTDRRKDASGTWVDQTEWHNIVTFGNTATNCQKYLKKGSKVFIEGKIQTRKWQDKEGKDRYTTEILANTVQFLTPKSAGGGDASAYNNPAQDASADEGSSGAILSGFKSADELSMSGGSAKDGKDVAFDDDDIPF